LRTTTYRTQLRRLAHQLCGIGTSFGYKMITDIAANLEMSAEQGDSYQIEQYLKKIATIIN